MYCKHFDEKKYIFEKVIGCGKAQSVQLNSVGIDYSVVRCCSVGCGVAQEGVA
jgi:hypothetical protein